MTRRPSDPPPLDRNLPDRPPEERWREWMGRVEAVIFASPAPVPRAVLARVVGDDCPLDAVIAAIRAELVDRPYDLAAVAGGWRHRTRPCFAAAIRAAAATETATPLAPADLSLLAAVAYLQPVTRRDLERRLGRPADAGRLRSAGLVTFGPRSPRPGAPLTLVTTDAFLDRFGLNSLADLPGTDELRALGFDDSDLSCEPPAFLP